MSEQVDIEQELRGLVHTFSVPEGTKHLTVEVGHGGGGGNGPGVFVVEHVERADLSVPPDVEESASRLELSGKQRADAMRAQADLLLLRIKDFHAKVYAYAARAESESLRVARDARAQGARTAALDESVSDAFAAYEQDIRDYLERNKVTP